MFKDFEQIYKKTCDFEPTAYEGVISHLLGKSYTDQDEAIVCAFLSGVFYSQEEAKGGRVDG